VITARCGFLLIRVPGHQPAPAYQQLQAALRSIHPELEGRDRISARRGLSTLIRITARRCEHRRDRDLGLVLILSGDDARMFGGIVAC